MSDPEHVPVNVPDPARPPERSRAERLREAYESESDHLGLAYLALQVEGAPQRQLDAAAAVWTAARKAVQARYPK